MTWHSLRGFSNLNWRLKESGGKRASPRTKELPLTKCNKLVWRFQHGRLSLENLLKQNGGTLRRSSKRQPTLLNRLSGGSLLFGGVPPFCFSFTLFGCFVFFSIRRPSYLIFFDCACLHPLCRHFKVQPLRLHQWMHLLHQHTHTHRRGKHTLHAKTSTQPTHPTQRRFEFHTWCKAKCSQQEAY